MKKRNLSFLLGLLALLLAIAPPALAQTEEDPTETAEIRAVIREYIRNTMFAADTLQDCLGLSGAASCKVSDAAGFGLNCPQTSFSDPADPTTNHYCSVETSEEIDASITAFAKKVLGMSGGFTTEFRMVSKESSATHNHQVCAEKAGTCAEKFVGRHEVISGFIAVFQNGEVDLALPKTLEEVGTYTAAVKAAKGRVIEVINQHWCAWEDHGEPYDCFKEPSGPTTPGGTTGEPTGPTTPGGTTGEPGGTTTGGDADTTGDTTGDTTTEPNLCEEEIAQTH